MKYVLLSAVMWYMFNQVFNFSDGIFFFLSNPESYSELL